MNFASKQRQNLIRSVFFAWLICTAVPLHGWSVQLSRCMADLYSCPVAWLICTAVPLHGWSVQLSRCMADLYSCPVAWLICTAVPLHGWSVQLSRCMADLYSYPINSESSVIRHQGEQCDVENVHKQSITNQTKYVPAHSIAVYMHELQPHSTTGGKVECMLLSVLRARGNNSPNVKCGDTRLIFFFVLQATKPPILP